jgi:cation diffusion facilitator CzcD-associated flavoprotein CzcO
VTGIHVEAEAEVIRIEPSMTAPLHKPIFELTVRQGGVERKVCARTLVIASGAEGSGARQVPAVIRDALPAHLYAHSNDAIDFGALKGKRIGVLGAGASAFDNAATALEHGASEAHICVRRAVLPRSNPRRWMEFSGYLAHYPDLLDADKWQYMHRLYDIGQPPPEPTFARATALPGFHLQTSTPWDAVAVTPSGTIAVTSGQRTLEFDFVISSTGMVVDMAARPELATIARAVSLWGDVYEPPADLADTRLERFPYLGRYCDFKEKTPGSAPWAGHAFTITRGATLSMGPSAASNSNMKYTAPRIVSGVTRALFLDGAAEYRRRFDEYDHRELREAGGGSTSVVGGDVDAATTAVTSTATSPATTTTSR